MRKKIIWLALIFLAVWGITIPCYAATDRADLVTAPVTFNGTPVVSESAKYPLLLYRDITYLPVEPYQEFLGISCRWSETAGGYYIAKETVRTKELSMEKTARRNTAHCTVQIPDCQVYVVDRVEPRAVPNRDLPYPVLQFRDVLYFPLTWEYAHNVFGWDYRWDAQNGLVIDSRDAIRPEIDYLYPEWERTPHAASIERQYTYFPDGYAEYYKLQEDPTFLLNIKVKGHPVIQFDMEFRNYFFPKFEGYTMPAKINQFWSEPWEKIEDVQYDIEKDGDKVTVPFVYLTNPAPAPDTLSGRNWTGVQNCLVTLDLTTQKLVSVEKLSVEEVRQRFGE